MEGRLDLDLEDRMFPTSTAVGLVGGHVSIRKLFASDRGLFANGGKSIMMGTRCHHCQSQRRADGSQAQVDTRKHDSLGLSLIHI